MGHRAVRSELGLFLFSPSKPMQALWGGATCSQTWRLPCFGLLAPSVPIIRETTFPWRLL